MQRSTDHILTTHAGSLIRPTPVMKLMKQMELHQPIDEAAFDKAVTDGVKDAVEQQLRIGMDVIGDGETARMGFVRYVYDRLGGFEPREYEPNEDAFGAFRRPGRENFDDYYAIWEKAFRLWWPDPEVPIDDIPNVPGLFMRFSVVEKPFYKGQAAIKREIERLKDALKGREDKVADVFLPATHPAALFKGDPDILKKYPNYETFMFELADACAVEYKAIADAGYIIQIDWSGMLNAGWYQLNNPTAEQKELIQATEIGIEALNYGLRDIPEEQIRFHYCSGSGLHPHIGNPALRESLLPMIVRIKAQAYGIEAAHPRHAHEWMIFKDKDVKLPDGKILIPGVIAENYQVVEHPELVAWRIENWASVIGKENLIAGIDCGFSQHWDARQTVPSVQWAKFQSLVDGAALASKKLWSN